MLAGIWTSPALGGELAAIAHSSAWLKLLHYKSSTWRQAQSQLAGTKFFLAPSGNVDPLAELEATLQALRHPNNLDEKQQSARCIFPARAEFLSARLGENFAPVPCPDLEAWLAALAPSGVSIVFASAYSSNPASLFGHTLLRIEHTQTPALLAYAVHYAAVPVNDDNPIVYMAKGLTGGYPGFYMLSPYHDLVSLYTDGESRDLWEYSLNLTADEARKLCLHLWELMNTAWAPYWFFDENCSYALLSLLEAVRPQTHLLQRFPGVVIPLASIRALRTEGFISELPKRRPSRKADSRAWLERLTLAERLAAFDAAQAQESSARPTTPVLDGAIAILDYRKMKNHGILPPHEHRNMAWFKELRAQRDPDASELAIHAVSVPDTQSASQKFRSGARHQKDTDYALLTYTYGLHSQLDPAAGYEPWESIDYLSIDLLVRDPHTVAIDHLLVAEVEALSPWTLLDRRFAWHVYLGASRYSNSLVPEAAAGIGEAFEIHSHLLIYALGGLRVFPTWQTWQRNSGMAAALGILANWERLRMRVAGEKLFAPWAVNSKVSLAYLGEAQYDLSQTFSLSLRREYDALRLTNYWQIAGLFRF